MMYLFCIVFKGYEWKLCSQLFDIMYICLCMFLKKHTSHFDSVTNFYGWNYDFCDSNIPMSNGVTAIFANKYYCFAVAQI